MKTCLPAVLFATLLSGCVGPGGPPGMGGPGGAPMFAEDDAGPPAMLFISPMGEPFRASFGQPYPSTAWFAGADADHDGVLTRAEFVQDALRFFDVLDRNRSGALNDADIAHYETVLAPEITRVPSMMGPPGGMRPPSGMGGPPGGGMGGGGMGGPPGGGMGGGMGGGRGGPPGGGMGGGGMGGGGMGGGPPGGGMGGAPSGAPPSGGQRMAQIPEGAALYGLLPFPEPVTSAHQNYGESITRARFAAAASARFDMLAVHATEGLRLVSLPQTPVQSMMGFGPRGRGRGRPVRPGDGT